MSAIPHPHDAPDRHDLPRAFFDLDTTANLNRAIGRRSRQLRALRRLSDWEAAGLLGITPTRLKGEEEGRFGGMGAGTLLRLAIILDVPVQAFFDGIADGQPKYLPDAILDADDAVMEHAALLTRMTAEDRDALYELLEERKAL